MKMQKDRNDRRHVASRRTSSVTVYVSWTNYILDDDEATAVKVDCTGERLKVPSRGAERRAGKRSTYCNTERVQTQQTSNIEQAHIQSRRPSDRL